MHTDRMRTFRFLTVFLLLTAIRIDPGTSSDAPQIIVPTENTVMLIAGETAGLNCIATGIPTPVVVWKKNGDDFPQLSGDGSSLLVIENVVVDDIGTYTCEAENGVQDSEGNLIVDRMDIQVSVTAAAKITAPTEDVMVMTGQNITLNCTATGIPTPVVVWKKNGEKYPQMTGHGNSLLVMENAVAYDSGAYTCEAENGVKDSEGNVIVDRVNIQVSVTDAPKIIAPTETNLIAMEGENITLNCIATGIPTPTLVWKKNGEDYPQMSGDGNSLLVIENVVVDDIGTYTCKAENGVQDSEGNLILDRMDIQVFVFAAPTDPLAAPKIIASTENVIAMVGENITLTCIAAGIPTPVVVWKKNGDEYPQMSGQGNSVVLIEDVVTEDSGAFRCEAENGAMDSEGNVIVDRVDIQVSVTETTAEPVPRGRGGRGGISPGNQTSSYRQVSTLGGLT